MAGINTSVRKFFFIVQLLLIYFAISADMVLALNPGNISDCLATSVGNPSCTFQMEGDSDAVISECIRPEVFRVIGDYKVFYINCTASYPLNFKFDGRKPTEAVNVNQWVEVEKHSEGKFKSFHMDIKILSIPSLHEYYSSLYPERSLSPLEFYSYSRTGNYIFSGHSDQAQLQSQFYIFFEEETAKKSFIRNEDVKLGFLKTKTDNVGETMEYLVIPCRPSHFYDNVTLKQTGNWSENEVNFTYDPTVGFTSVESVPELKFELNNTEIAQFTCQDLGNSGIPDDVILFSTKNLIIEDVKFGFDGLPKPSGVGITYNVRRLDNGTILIEPICRSFNTEGEQSGNTGEIVTIISQGNRNPIMYQLERHFILPAFSNQSYAVTRKSQVLQRGEVLTQRGTFFLNANTFCGGRSHYQVDTIGVGVTGIHISYKFFDLKDLATKNGQNFNIGNYFAISNNQVSNVLYKNADVTFRCYIKYFYYVPPAIWYTERINGTVVEESIDYDWKDTAYSYATIKLTEDIRKVRCNASLWNKAEWRGISVDVTLQDSLEPTFDGSLATKLQFPLNSMNKIIKCTAEGTPDPFIYWQRHGKNISQEKISRLHHTARLEFSKIKQEDEGEYICIASNVQKTNRLKFTVNVFTEHSYGLTVGIPVVVLICSIIVLSTWVYIIHFRKQTAGLTKSEIDDFFNGEGENEGDGNSSLLMQVDGKSNEYVHDITHMCSYNKDYEISPDRFVIDAGKVVGAGAYGMVVKGSLDRVAVAVKTVKKNADKSYLKTLLCELKVMIFLGTHENLVGVLGASTTNLNKGQVYIFVPFCDLGSLEDYLKKNRHLYIANNDPLDGKGSTSTSENTAEKTIVQVSSNPDPGNLSTITLRDLYEWSIQIANGMDYLSSKKVLHGDLAARNILLTSDRTAKITDFGLSRKLYNYAEYSKRQQQPLPWRYMSIESLRDLTFSTKSDVWSYGVLLWEIFTLAQVPYPGYSWTLEFVNELESGLRLGKPQLATDELYEGLMEDCWRSEPQIRPSFSYIRDTLKTMNQS